MVLYETTRHLLHWKEGMDHNLLNVAEEPVYHIHSHLDGAERVAIWLQVAASVGGHKRGTLKNYMAKQAKHQKINNINLGIHGKKTFFFFRKRKQIHCIRQHFTVLLTIRCFQSISWGQGRWQQVGLEVMHIPLGARPFVGRLAAMLLNLGTPWKSSKPGLVAGFTKKGSFYPPGKSEKFTHETRPETQKGSRIVFQAPFLFRGFCCWFLGSC